MEAPRISASSYSNTAPLVWSFLYGSNHGKVELILDNAPARSAELLNENRVDAALVPVIAYQLIPDAKLISGVCVGAREAVRSVCLVTRGMDLSDVRSVSLDVSSRTSAALSKVIFREFIGTEPVWKNAPPDADVMLAECDAALLIGDPALRLAETGGDGFRVFDMVELWRKHTGLGFIFAMWMTRKNFRGIDFAAACDEGRAHIEGIVTNYHADIGVSREVMTRYLSENISYTPDQSMLGGMDLYFKLAAKHKLCPEARMPEYV